MTDSISAKLQDTVTTMNFGLLSPHLIVAIGAIVLMLVSLLGKRAYIYNAILTMIILVGTGCYVGSLGVVSSKEAFNGMFEYDFFSHATIILYCIIGVFTILISVNYLKRRNLDLPEFFPMLLFAITGMMFMTSTADLMVFYIGLETLSIALYVLAGIDTKEMRSTEAGIKYFLMSVFASAFLLFGIAFIYGATGSTSLSVLKSFVGQVSFSQSHFLYIGILLILAGIAFKISVVPFHMWTPDVYQGAPLSVTALLSTGPKIASFAFLFKIFFQFQGTQPYPELLQDIIVGLAAITMIGGNLLALNQLDIKRMLAFSSITHMGYVMTAFASHSATAISSSMFYFVAYIFMNMGMFSILGTLSKDGDRNLTIENFRGLAAKKPGVSAMLLIFLFSLAGIPPMMGFVAKFFVFSAVIDAKMYGLAVFGILNSAISAYYYLRVVVNIYLKSPEEGKEASFQEFFMGVPEKITIAGCLLVVVLAGIQPSYLLEWVGKITL